MRIQTIAAIALGGQLLTACASSQQSFIQKSETYGDVKVCRNYLKDFKKFYPDYVSQGDTEDSYLHALKSELDRRGLSYESCKEKVDKANATIALGVLAAAALTYAVSESGGDSSGGTGASNTGYAWDQFYDQYGNLVWRCRDKSNGRFAYDYQCASSYQVDTTWPGK